MSSNPFADFPPMSEEELDACAARLETLPEEHADWVMPLLLECKRARAGAPASIGSEGNPEAVAADLTQIVLDTAEWLRTLWEVGYMGAATLPVPPRTHFPQIEVEDVVKSALFARIRQGKHPLPFPPPTRWGSPWHEVVESNEAQSVEAEIIEDEGQPAFAIVDGCNRWRIVRVEDGGAAKAFVVQHEGKGPLYRLTPDPFMSTLQRLPPEVQRRILVRERAGMRSFALEWLHDNGRIEEVPLRAATREGAEATAGAWIARHHPAHYGRIGFEHA
ncbi:MAG: hypothetical protein IPO00_06850 [Betaproteobacteria bacterium]|nr:hypothetical protein [Betaproteobacteria bacterium]